VAKYLIVAVVLAVAAYQQFVLWQLKRRGPAGSFFHAQTALMREITARAMKGSVAAQLHHAALFGAALWVVFGLGYYLTKQS
jgi:hypothetical protein